MLDLASIPIIGRLNHKVDKMAKHLPVIQEQVKLAIQEANTQYKAQVDSHRRQVLLMLMILFGLY